MGVLGFGRITNWLSLSNLTAANLNEEFNNLFTGLEADTISGASGDPATLQQMQATQDPEDGSNLPLTIQDEIREIRYQLDGIIGEDYWYSTPPISLSALAGVIGSNSSAILSSPQSSFGQPLFLTPDGAAASVVTTFPVTARINGQNHTFESELELTGLLTAPASNNTALVNDTTLTGTVASQTAGEGVSQLAIDTIGSEISALANKVIAFKINTSVGIGVYNATASALVNVQWGQMFDDSGAEIVRAGISNNDTVTLLKLAWLFLYYDSATETESLLVTYNQPKSQGSAPASPSIGDIYFNTTSERWFVRGGGGWTETPLAFAGLVVTNTTAAIGARSADYFLPYSSQNSVELTYQSSALLNGGGTSRSCSVYGVLLQWPRYALEWSTTDNMAFGETFTASTAYYVYIGSTFGTVGDLYISATAPQDRRGDLCGYYHPARPWRCVGSFNSNASPAIDSTSVLYGQFNGSNPQDRVTTFQSLSPVVAAYDKAKLSNLSLTAAASTTNLLVTLVGADGNPLSNQNPAVVSFISATAANAALYQAVVMNAPITLTVPTDPNSTLGFVSGCYGKAFIYACEYLGSVYVGACGQQLVDTSLVQGIAITTGATSRNVLYVNGPDSVNYQIRYVGTVSYLISGGLAPTVIRTISAPSQVQVPNIYAMAHLNGSNQTGVNPNNSDVMITLNSLVITGSNGGANSSFICSSNATGGWATATTRFITPETGLYQFEGAAHPTSTNVISAGGATYALRLKVGSSTSVAYGSATVAAQGQNIFATGAQEFSLTIASTLYLYEGQVVYFGLFGSGDNSASTLTLNGSVALTNLTIRRV